MITHIYDPDKPDGFRPVVPGLDTLPGICQCSRCTDKMKWPPGWSWLEATGGPNSGKVPIPWSSHSESASPAPLRAGSWFDSVGLGLRRCGFDPRPVHQGLPLHPTVRRRSVKDRMPPDLLPPLCAICRSEVGS